MKTTTSGRKRRPHSRSKSAIKTSRLVQPVLRRAGCWLRLSLETVRISASQWASLDPSFSFFVRPFFLFLSSFFPADIAILPFFASPPVSERSWDIKDRWIDVNSFRFNASFASFRVQILLTRRVPRLPGGGWKWNLYLLLVGSRPRSSLNVTGVIINFIDAVRGPARFAISTRRRWIPITLAASLIARITL